MSDVEVRGIEPDELGALLELCREHAAYEKAEFRDDGQVGRWDSAMFVEPTTLHGWIAVDGGEVCGFMTVTTDFATWSARRFAHMDCLYIRESYRGRGIGRLFLDELRAFATSRGCDWAEWQTPTDNALGIGFYERMGALSKHKRRFTYETRA